MKEQRMMQVLISLSESAYKEMCENGVEYVDYDIKQMMRNGTPLPEGTEILTKEAYSDLCLRASKERKTGRWIEVLYVGNDNYDWECSECGFKDTHSKDVVVPFCWHCGARMGGAENEDTTDIE